MKIEKIKDYKKTNFSAGLSRNMLMLEKKINVPVQEKLFKQHCNIETNFNKNKSIALANVLCTNIFQELFQRLGTFSRTPWMVTVFDRSSLINKNSMQNFCIPDTKKVLVNEYPYPGRSLFFEKVNCLEDVNSFVEYQNSNKISSSPHFLAPFIHEWIHSFHLDYIYKKNGYGGECKFLDRVYPKFNTNTSGVNILNILAHKTLSEDENRIIFDILGEYATKPNNQYLEIFAEACTKYICESLSPDCNLIKDPLDSLKKSPREFQKILKKILE